MLTLDLLRFRVTGDVVSPVYLTTTGGRKYLDMAEALIGIFNSCVGRTLGELEEEIEDSFGAGTDYKVYRGLAKIMAGYIETEPPARVVAEELRKQVFTMAARSGPVVRRSDLLFEKTAAERAAEIARDVGIDPDILPVALYSDLKSSQVITRLDRSVTAVELIERYNTALAQAMLYRATRMIIDVGDSYRTVFKYIKLARLMHTITPRESGYRIEIDGPLSLFANVERYGVAMAKLLPAILKCSEWRLAAKVNVGGTEKLFRLSPQTGLKSHYRDEPVFDSSTEEAFYAKFRRNKKANWTIEREGSILDLRETVLIPDFKFTHVEDGRVAHLEIVGFWTPEYLARKLEKLSRVEESNVVVAVPNALNCSDRVFTGPVVRYSRRLMIKDVLPAIEKVAVPQK